MTPTPPFSILARSFAGGPRPRTVAVTLGLLWLAIFAASLFSPPLLDDADATHAQAARAMLATGDLVTLHVNGIRYLEKAPLPYWLVAFCYKLFGANTFATHFPEALAVALLALVGHRWANQAFGARTAFYTAVATLTSAGVFLFTRIFIPEALLSLFLATALFAFLKSLHPVGTQPSSAPFLASSAKCGVNNTPARPSACPNPLPAPVLRPVEAIKLSPVEPVLLTGTGTGVPTLALRGEDWTFQGDSSSADYSQPERPAVAWYAGPHFYPYVLWTALACAVLTKGLVALIFFFGTATLYLSLTGDYRQIRRLKPISGMLLFLAFAAPWHILAGLRNTGGADGHGFFWFYFINEHILRFLGRRIPRDYNKVPGYFFWLQHLVWLFPWSLFLPLAAFTAWRGRRIAPPIPRPAGKARAFEIARFVFVTMAALTLKDTLHLGFFGYVLFFTLLLAPSELAIARRREGLPISSWAGPDRQTFAHRTILLLTLFAALVLLFFSFSTNQEYYTFPAYLPILLLTCATISRAEQTYSVNATSRRWIRFAHAAFTLLGAIAATALAYGLWTSRHLPFVPDIGDLLAHRSVGDYTLATSHLFDLTGPSFAALRLPAALALFAFALGPAVAWTLRMQRRHIAATTSIALTSGLFLVAAHIAFARFAPMLSSEDLAAKIQELEDDHRISRENQVLVFGDQAFGSSIPFYLNRQVLLVEGRSTSLLFGSAFADAPPIFLTSADLLATWGKGERKLLFVPAERRDEADRLLGSNQTILEETSGKALITDRPLNPIP